MKKSTLGWIAAGFVGLLILVGIVVLSVVTHGFSRPAHILKYIGFCLGLPGMLGSAGLWFYGAIQQRQQAQKQGFPFLWYKNSACMLAFGGCFGSLSFLVNIIPVQGDQLVKDSIFLLTGVLFFGFVLCALVLQIRNSKQVQSQNP
jgi:hypothetical protein